jgi:aspartate aminotransferase
MTGWRIGYAAAPPEVARAMSNLQDQVTSNPTSFAQKGALEALVNAGDEAARMREVFRRRRDLMHAGVVSIPDVRAGLPKGAFYILADFSRHLSGRIPSDADLAEHLLDTAHVATIPGSVFGAPGFLRLSYATSEEEIVQGVERLRSAVCELPQ